MAQHETRKQKVSKLSKRLPDDGDDAVLGVFSEPFQHETPTAALGTGRLPGLWSGNSQNKTLLRLPDFPHPPPSIPGTGSIIHRQNERPKQQQ